MTVPAREIKNRWWLPFFTIWGGQTLSILGSSIAQFALIFWLTLESGGSATVLALASMVGKLPQVVIAPFVGAYIDRSNRRAIMIVSDSAIALASLWLALLFLSGAAQIWHVVAVMFIRSLGGAFHGPSMMSSTSLMVPKEHLPRVSGLNQAVRQGFLNIISPIIAAPLVAFLPLQNIMGLDVATAMLAVIPLLFIAVPQPPRRATGAAPTSYFQEVKEGFRFIWDWKGVFYLLLLAIVLNFLVSPAFSLIPIYVNDYFAATEAELAANIAKIDMAFGAAMFAGGIFLSVWGGFKRKMLTALVALALSTIGPILMGLAPSSGFGLALAGIAIFAFFNPLVNGPINALFQSVIPPEMQGRAFTTVGAITGLMTPVGMAIAGPIADAFGVEAWYFFVAVGYGVVSVMAFLNKTIMNVEKDGHPDGAAPTDERPSIAMPIPDEAA